MKTIIVPTGFSAISLNEVNYVADMAVATHAELLLVVARFIMDGYSVASNEWKWYVDLILSTIVNYLKTETRGHNN